MEGYERLKALSERMKKEVKGGLAPNPEKQTVRELIGWFGYGRRGSLLVGRIRRSMSRLDLRTVPEFEYAWLDEVVSITLDPDAVEGIASSEEPIEPIEPTVRIGALDAANRPPARVNPDDELNRATTLMLMNDYSQLPVMQNERDVKGIIHWKSIAIRLALGRECRFVRECMETSVPEARAQVPLSSAIGLMHRHGYVLVRAEDRRIAGIVTWGDVTQQFIQLAGPFLTVGEIEGYLRRLVHQKFTADEVREAMSDTEGGQAALGPEDLTLGGYCQLLGQPQHWDKLGLDLDRKQFIEKIDWVREKRNDVMHFAPEGLDSEDIEKLENVARFFRALG